MMSQFLVKIACCYGGCFVVTKPPIDNMPSNGLNYTIQIGEDQDDKTENAFIPIFQLRYPVAKVVVM